MARLAVALVVISALAVVFAASGRAADPQGYKVEVQYAQRDCAAGRPKLARVTAGTLELRRRGAGRGVRPVRVSLLDVGTRPATVDLPGRGPVVATLVLETPRVKIVDGAQSRTVIRIPLGSDVPDRGRLVYSVKNTDENPGRAADENGRVNTLIVLQRAARVAANTAPQQLPQVVVRVHGDSVRAGYSASFEKPATIHVRGADWEPTPQAHEYGHFLLSVVAPDKGPGGDHHAARSYPGTPELAWSEGFPAAFAALVLAEGAGSLFVECGKPYQNLAAEPATPALETADDRRYAQYNETRVGAVAYQLVTEHLGGGQVGLKRLLQALNGYRRGGHSVWTARDLRDLAALEFERSSADHVKIDKIFGGQRLSWFRGFGVSLDVADLATSGMVLAIPEISVRVTGPGLSCAASGADVSPVPAGGNLLTLDDGSPVLGDRVADGGLQFSANDDCYLAGGDGAPNPIGQPSAILGNAVLPFLHLGGLTHWSSSMYVLEALYACQTQPPLPSQPPPNCPATAAVQLVLSTQNDFSPSPAIFTDVRLGNGVWKPLVEFSASGTCTVVAAGPASNPDCGF